MPPSTSNPSFVPGDIVQIYAPVAGKPKYHLCVCAWAEGSTAQFLYINSNQGYEADYILDCAKVPCIPPSSTGDTVISCNIVARYTDHQLNIYRAQKIGTLDIAVVRDLVAFVEVTPALTRGEKRLIIANLKTLL